MILWWLHSLIPKGIPGHLQPLWPGKLAALFLLLGVVYSGLVWMRLPAPPMGRRRRAVLAALALASFGLLDWALLAALPRLGLSYGPLTFPLIAITALRLVVFTLLAMSVYASYSFNWLKSLRRLPFLKALSGVYAAGRSARILNAALLCLWLANAALLALELDGLYLEPFDLRTSHVQLVGPLNASGQPLRILHLTDLHIERITRRERELIQRAAALHPDLILLTGDYTNVDYLDDERALRDTRTVLSQLSAPYGVYAVSGSTDSADLMENVFGGLPITVLADQLHKIQLGQQELYLVGVSNLGLRRDQQALAELMRQVSPAAYSILLYHTPDLVEVADRLHVDLYLAGHTHGGQVRLPIWGALITMSAYGKQYESGLYRLSSTALYVSRGIGLEGLSLPRVRFLCPPELVVLDLSADPTP